MLLVCVLELCRLTSVYALNVKCTTHNVLNSSVVRGQDDVLCIALTPYIHQVLIRPLGFRHTNKN